MSNLSRRLRERCTFSRVFPAAAGALFLALAWGTIPDYGVHWDHGDYLIGDRTFHFFKSLDSRHMDLRRRTLPLYSRPDHPDFFRHAEYQRSLPHRVWPLGPTASSVTKHVLFTWLGIADPIDAHHAVVPLFAVLLAVALFGFAYRNLGPVPAATAMICLLSYPRFWSHIHYNARDIPSCALICLVIFLFYEAVTHRRWKPLLGAGVVWGLALAAKPNALLLPFVLGPFLLLVLTRRRRAGEPLLGAPAARALAATPGVVLLFMFAAWPLLWRDFPDAVVRHANFLLARSATGTPDWNATPVILAFGTMPIPVLALFAAGLAAIVNQTYRARRLSPLHLLLLLLLVVPVLRASLPHAVDFDGIRHWIEFVPAVALIAGIGAAAAVRVLRRYLPGGARAGRAGPALISAALIGVVFGPVLLWNARNHPHQVVFFNALIGGLAGAQRRGIPEATDYWGVSYRHGMRWLNANAPARTMLLVGVGDHIVRMPRKIWLRPDIALGSPRRRDGARRGPGEVRAAIRRWPASVYVMYVTRKGYYAPWLRELDRAHPPVHHVQVDGGSVLKILKVK